MAAAARNAPFAACTLDGPRVASCTKQFEGLTGLGPRADLFAALDEHDAERLRRAIARGGATSVALRTTEGPLRLVVTAGRDDDESVLLHVRVEDDVVLEASNVNALLDALPLGLMVVGRDLRYRIARGGIVASYGLCERDIVGRHATEAHDLSIIEKYQRALDGETTCEEATVQGRTYLRCVRPVRDASGEIVAAATLAVDVTSRRHAQEAARLSERFFGLILDALPTPIFVYDRDGHALLSNEANARLFGTTAREFDGTTPGVPPDADEELTRMNREIIDSGEPRFVPEQSVDTTDGRKIFQLRKVPIHLPDGRRAVLGVAEDITERKDLERRLVHADRLAAVGTLAGGVAHEINNPLAWLVTNLGVCVEDVDAIATEHPALDARCRALRDALSDALGGAERIRTIVADLRMFARPEQETNQPLDVRGVLESTLQVAWNEIRHRARVVRALEPVPRIIGNEARVAQVFLNVLVNAVQAMPDGDLARNVITVALRADGEQVLFEVQDNGRGIDAAHLQRVFDPFFTTKSVGGGTGLGLSICHGIVRAMGGRIELESEVGVGTKVRVWFPASHAPSVPPSSGQERAAPREGRILVIDDEPSVAKAFARACPSVEVVTRTARELLAEPSVLRGVDVCFVDVMMPDMNGLDLVDELTRRTPMRTPIVFMTGGVFDEGSQERLETSRHAVLRKPFGLAEIRSAVADHVRTSVTRR